MCTMRKLAVTCRRIPSPLSFAREPVATGAIIANTIVIAPDLDANSCPSRAVGTFNLFFSVGPNLAYLWKRH